MTLGFLFSMAAGFLWAVVAVIMTAVRRRGYPVCHFYACGTLLAGMFSLAVWAANPIGANQIPKLLPYLLAAAAANAIAQTVTIIGLKKDNCALYFSIAQTNFVFTFIILTCFFHGVSSWQNWSGVILIATAVITSSMLRSGNAGQKLMPAPTDLALGLLAACMGGINAVLMLRAATVENVPDILKTALFCLCGSFFHILRSIQSKDKPRRKDLTHIVFWGSCWAILAILSYLAVFMASSQLEPLGRSSLIYAIGASTNIILYWLYSVIFLKTGFSLVQAGIMAGIVAGIIIFRLS